MWREYVSISWPLHQAFAFYPILLPSTMRLAPTTADKHRKTAVEVVGFSSFQMTILGRRNLSLTPEAV
jgi:hypothetical protein